MYRILYCFISRGNPYLYVLIDRLDIERIGWRLYWKYILLVLITSNWHRFFCFFLLQKIRHFGSSWFIEESYCCICGRHGRLHTIGTQKSLWTERILFGIFCFVLWIWIKEILTFTSWKIRSEPLFFPLVLTGSFKVVKSHFSL